MKAVFVQRDEKSAKRKAAEVVRLFQHRFPKAMEIFEAGLDDVPSYLYYPVSHRTRVSSTNPLEWVNNEARRRTRVVGIFLHRHACQRLIGVLLVEMHEDWLTDDKAYLLFDDAPAEEPAAKVVPMAVALLERRRWVARALPSRSRAFDVNQPSPGDVRGVAEDITGK